MEENNNNSGLNKLLPKSLTAKRRRRKQKKAVDEADDGRGRRLSSSARDSDDTTSASTANDDTDGRSFGSYESNAGPSPEIESSPVRPGTISTHPSLIGYLTTSSPEIQATHFDPQAQARSQSRLHSPASSQLDRADTASRGGSPARSSQKSGRRAVTPPPPEPPAAAQVASPDQNSRQPPPTIETTSPPRTPKADDKSAPAIVNTPPTPTGSTRSSLSPSLEGRRSLQVSTSPGADGGAAWRNMNTHRRSKSGSVSIGPSKLSNIISAPPTPTPETHDATGPSTPTGFFSSMLSAAQTAASNLSTNIQNTNLAGIGVNKKTAVAQRPSPEPESTAVEVEPSAEAREDDTMEQKESAIRTLGAGDLSLSHLGLVDSPSGPSPGTTRFPDIVDTRARSESAPVETGAVDLISEGQDSRPRSLNEAHSGDHTPPQPADLIEASKSGLHRSSSIRSAIKPHRKRGSSVTTSGTGGAIGAAIAAAHAASAPSQGANYGAPKLTGFAIASKKRNRDFHTFFKSVPDDDYLIEDYSCALQREILAHGRLYVSEGHLCFSSNILGWTTTLVMSFDEIVSVEKRSTALVFKNGLMISTLHAKHVFASFTSRDATYDLIVNIWKLGHPTLKSTLNGVRLEGTGGDKTEKVDNEQNQEADSQAGSDSDEDSEDDEEEFYYEEESQEAENPSADLNTADGADGDAEKTTSRRVSSAVPGGNGADSAKDSGSGPGGAVDYPGPATHGPTECGDSASHFDRVVGDDTIPAPLGKVYNLMFGQPSVTYMSKWLTVDQKCTELQMEDKKGLGPENKSRSYSYIKPLYSSIGPRQTKCIVTETVGTLDFEKSALMDSSTQTPDVPSGNVFAVKTKYCLTWAENNSTRVFVTCTIEWTGKSWLKGPIEKGAFDGQTQHFKDLFGALKTEVSSRTRAPTATNGGTRLVKKKGKKSKSSSQVGDGAPERDIKAKRAAKQDWGLLEPVRGVLEPVVDILQPILTGNVMYGLLVGLLVASWFGFGFPPGKNPTPYGPDAGIYSPDRLAAYEEMWRREDSELWDWLEERVGLGRLDSDAPLRRKRAVEPRTVEEKLREERMDDREVDEAIRVTEEKLKVLRDVVGKAAQESAGEGGHTTQ